MEQYIYAEPTLEKALDLRFKPVPLTAIEHLLETLQDIADPLSSGIPDAYVPPKGVLTTELTPRKRRLLNQALVPVYAERNVTQQESLLNVEIVGSDEPMQSLIARTRHQVDVTFSNRPIHEACGESAGQRRLFYLRQGVTDRVFAVCKALNGVDLMAHVEDCWRHPEVQEGLYIRRIIEVARDYEEYGWNCEQVKKASRSFTASIPGLAGHVAGAAIDLRIRHRSGQREFLDLGNDYPDGEAVSSLDFPYLTLEQWKARTIFAETMRIAGFKLLRTEDWHASHGDRGLSVDSHVHMRKAMYGPLIGFDRTNGSVQPYPADLIDRPFLTDQEVEDLVDEARERKPGSKEYRYTVVELAERLRAARRGEAVE